MAVAHERVRYDNFNVLVTPPGFQTIRQYPVRDNSAVRLEITITARQTDGNERASFRRTAVFFRNAAGATQIQGPTWLTDQTLKSNGNMDIKYILGPTDVALVVRNSDSVATRWVGYVHRVEVH